MRPEPPPPSLARLQRWMQAVTTHPCCAVDGLVSAEALREHSEEELSLLVSGDERLSPIERLGIYQGMHLPRMRDALASDYPLVLELCGEDAFVELVRAYVAVHPSRSYTLNRLGDRFPDFLETHGPVRRRARRASLARLELAMTRVFDEAESPVVSQDEIAAVPAGAWPGARLVSIAALAVVEVRRGTLALAEALRDGADAPRLGRGVERVLVWRRELGVKRRLLSPREARFLATLVTGATLGDAVEELAAGETAPSPATVAAWTRRFVGDGLVSRIDLS